MPDEVNEPSDAPQDVSVDSPQTDVRRSALQRAEEKAAEHLEGWRRARADYENLRKRMDDEVTEARETGKDALLHTLLSVIDHFETAAGNVPNVLLGNPWVAGMLQSCRAFRDFLTQTGVTPITETGIPLDPLQHEAIATEPSERTPGTVLAVVVAGYRRGSRVLRPAKVRVSALPLPNPSGLPSRRGRPSRRGPAATEAATERPSVATEDS